MILIGQYDSSFVRRVAVALGLYGIAFEQRPWSVVGDADKIAALNPLLRVPTLVLDDGDVLTDTHVILDYIDSLAPAGARLYPVDQPARRRAMAVAALASGLADKGVALFYEVNLHEHRSQIWESRCRAQIVGTLRLLEAQRPDGTPWWFGDTPGHADIAVTCSIRHIGEANPGVVDLAAYPRLAAHCERAEAHPALQAFSQTFIAPVSTTAGG